MALSSITLALFVNFLRGSKKRESIIEGFERCSPIDWGIFAIFIVMQGLLTFIGVVVNRREQALKEKVGIGLAKSDIRFKGLTLVQLLVGAFIGGWVGGALGLGGGSIFNPLLISMGVPPQVSTSTGMYMIMYSTLSSSVIYITVGTLDVPFSLWLGFWGAAGTIVGLKVITQMMKKYDRQSILVFVLSGVLIVSMVMVPIFNGMETADLLAEGKDIWKMTSICE